MNLTVTNEALNHELDRLRAKTDQLRNESPGERRNTLATLVAVINSLKRLGLVSHEKAAELHEAAQAIDSELACGVER
ncbi:MULTISPECIES: hypothetical protein [Pseudomonas]|uniref:Uncharacterized protein n=1 Tax=Pseudomonas fluorescens TaxID=294 RepID=A0A166QR26_PSEFL|nr:MULTISPECIES: hypothetical protein [Pseudomonas]KZN20723.1 hypothetical protein A1D17_04050 [Pseudomonas fluorescens]